MAQSLADIFPPTISPLPRSRPPRQREMPLTPVTDDGGPPPDNIAQFPTPPVTDDGGPVAEPPSPMTGVQNAGWTQIPNPWLEALARPDNGVTLREFRWLLGLARLCWGYHRDWVEMTRAEIAAISGYDLENCHRIVRRLSDAGLLRVERRPGRVSRFSLPDLPPREMTADAPVKMTGVKQAKMTGVDTPVKTRRGSKKRPQNTPRKRLPSNKQPREKSKVSEKTAELSTPPVKKTGGPAKKLSTPPVKMTGGPPPQIDGGYPSEFASDSADLRPKKTPLKKTLKKYIDLSHMADAQNWAPILDDCTRRERQKILSGLSDLHEQFPNDGGLLDAAPQLAARWGAPDGTPIRNLIGLLLHSWPRCRDYWQAQEAKAERSRHARRGSAQRAEADDAAAVAEQQTADAAFAKLTPVDQEAALRRHAKGVFDLDSRFGRMAAQAAWWEHEGKSA